MSQQQQEHVSALVDGELDPSLTGATVSALEASPELRAAWERYGLIGHALRGEAVNPHYRLVAARVREQLQSEPIPIRSIQPVSRKSREELATRTGYRLGPATGLALAASAAFFTVFALPQFLAPGHSARPGPALAVVETPVSSRSLLRDPPGPHLVLGSSPRWHQAEPALELKLDRFLVNHQARSPASGFKGFFPYATVVGYEAGR